MAEQLRYFRFVQRFVSHVAYAPMREMIAQRPPLPPRKPREPDDNVVPLAS